MSAAELLMYGELASWFHLVTAPEDYEEEATDYVAWLLEAGVPEGGTVLELGSGGGNNASWMKRTFELTLSDLSEGMLEGSRGLNPECEHAQGDMRTLRLGRVFDGVFVHDAVSYMTTEADLAAAIETAAIHTRPGGAALFVPDCVAETYEPGTDHGGHDGEDGRSLRYLEWSEAPRDGDTRYVTRYAYVLVERGQPDRLLLDVHEDGVFPRATWLRLLEKAGFGVIRSGVAGEGHDVQEMFLCRRKAKRESQKT